MDAGKKPASSSSSFNAQQLNEIRLGKKQNPELVYLYDDPIFTWRQIHEIRWKLHYDPKMTRLLDPRHYLTRSNSNWNSWTEDLMQEDLNYRYEDQEYNHAQLNQIRLGIYAGVDVSVYANPKWSWQAMQLARWGLEMALDVSTFLDVKYTVEQMNQIRCGLKEKLDVSIYADPIYTEYQMETIRLAMMKDEDVSKLLDPRLFKD